MTKTAEVQNDVSKNDKRIVRGKCVKCGSKKSRFIKSKVQKGGDFVNSLNAPGSLGGVDRLRRYTRKRRKEVVDYLS